MGHIYHGVYVVTGYRMPQNTIADLLADDCNFVIRVIKFLYCRKFSAVNICALSVCLDLSQHLPNQIIDVDCVVCIRLEWEPNFLACQARSTVAVEFHANSSARCWRPKRSPIN